jgi:hypothetical protein
MSNGEEVFGRLIDRGPATNLINRDGDLDQGIVLMNMVMEYLLVWLEDVTKSNVYLVKHLKSKWEKVGLTFGLITTAKKEIEEQKENRNICTISGY